MKNIFSVATIFGLIFLTLTPAHAHWGKSAPDAHRRASKLEYQIGAEWGKKVVTLESLKSESPVFQKSAKRTALLGSFVGGSTAFYLGKFNGHHVMATNNHVVESQKDCDSYRATFTLLDKKIFICQKYLWSWTDVDFSLFTIRVKPEDEYLLDGIGQNLAFDSKIYSGQKLLTIGHGFADNPNQYLVANQDSDCKVYSKTDEFRFMPDADDVSPLEYSVWSFANGCDVSHGDSGSAMVDRETGDIVGIIWTGRIPKEPKVQDPAYLSDIFSQNSEDIWKELSYAVPSSKIKEAITNSIGIDDLDVDTEETLRQILSNESK
jgi:hypothetical protein